LLEGIIGKEIIVNKFYMTQLTKINGHNFSFEEIEPNLKKHTGNLNQKPVSTEIKTNQQANNSKYIGIGTIESELDYIYNGLWSTENFRWQVVANEIIGSIDLKVFHPVAMVWITREGVGSVMIQQKKDSDIQDIGSKIKNTLVKDFPHLKAECIKNAAKSLGDRFGRNLNRNQEDDLSKLYDTANYIQEINDATKPSELSDIWKRLPKNAKNDLSVIECFTLKKNELNGNGKV
jgi:hypothetical protein